MGSGSCEGEASFDSPRIESNERRPEEEQTTTGDERAFEARLADVGARIDEIASRARGARDDTRTRVEHRLNSLRARQAGARSKMHAIESSDGSQRAITHELDRIDIDISIAQAQLDLDSADDPASFEAAVGQQIEAYRAYVELLAGSAGQRRESLLSQGDAIVESIRAGTAMAVERLQRYRDLSNEVSDSLRAGVLAALDDLDRAASQPD